MIEEWCPVHGFEHHYEVSSLGRVRRSGAAKGTQIGRVLKPWLTIGGYPTIYLVDSKRRTAKLVHLIVANAFLGDPCGREVNHIDGDKTNNAVTNLEYTSRKENAKHASSLGLMARGRRCPQAKLHEHQIPEIRRRGQIENRQILADEFKVSKSVIDSIVWRESWAWVPD